MCSSKQTKTEITQQQKTNISRKKSPKQGTPLTRLLPPFHSNLFIAKIVYTLSALLSVSFSLFYLVPFHFWTLTWHGSFWKKKKTEEENAINWSNWGRRGRGVVARKHRNLQIYELDGKWWSRPISHSRWMTETFKSCKTQLQNDNCLKIWNIEKSGFFNLSFYERKNDRETTPQHLQIARNRQ